MTRKDSTSTANRAEIQSWAQNLLDCARRGSPADVWLERLSNLPVEALSDALSDDAQRKAFWINLYNAFNLIYMKADPSISLSRSKRMRHFFRRSIHVAGERLSLVQIENDLLRRGRLWWSLGYVVRPFPRAFHRRFRVETFDPRIHFALNCGAMSCPPIRFYIPEEVDAQLETATAGFVETEVRRKEGQPDNHLYVSSIFRLYQGDFGGRKGIIGMIRRFRKDIPAERIRLHWLPYDWTSDLDAFV